VTATLRILVVCTGNVCRSPYGERGLRSAVAASGSVTVESAGTRALIGEPATPMIESMLAERGIDGTGHEARRLTAAVLADVDLVLTATRAHRAAVLDLRPVLLKRTFTIREFARIVAALQEESPATVPSIRDVADARALHRATAAEDDDVTDPYRLDDAVYRTMASELDATFAPIAAWAERLTSA